MMGSSSQYVEITSSFSESHRSTIATTTVASLALPMRWCRASFAATVCWRAARRCEYSAWGCDKIASVGRGLSLLLGGFEIDVVSRGVLGTHVKGTTDERR